MIAAAIEVVTWIAKKAIGWIKKLINDPEKAFMILGAGILGLVFLPMPIALIAVIPVVMGGIGAVTFIVAPATITAIGGGIGGFLTAISLLTPFGPLGIVLFVITIFVTLAVLTIFIIMIAGGAFTMPGEISETTTTTISPYFSEYFELKKTVVGNTKYEKPPNTITYKISLRPKKGTLRGSTLSEEIKVGKESNVPTISPHVFDDLPFKIDASGWETEYTINLDNRFEDSAIINTVKLSTSVEGIEGSYQGIANATVIIGEPPGDCPPFPWPTTGGITQGPEGATSHKKNHEEALDIGNSIGTPVYATHNGTAIIGKQSIGAGYYVEIHGNCSGLTYQTEYFHLLERDRVEGPVTRGQLIGYMDSSGGNYGSHLHYEFRPKRPNEPFLMEPPNIPSALPDRRCEKDPPIDIPVCGITIN